MLAEGARAASLHAPAAPGQVRERGEVEVRQVVIPSASRCAACQSA